MTTVTKTDAKLEIRHDGIRANASVRLYQPYQDVRVCSLDAVLDAALQKDRELAAEYQDILRQIAPQLYVRMELQWDGTPGWAVASWYEISLQDGINGEPLTRRTHRITSCDFPRRRPTEAEATDEQQAILRRAAAIGLADAQYWYGDARTVREAIKN